MIVSITPEQPPWISFLFFFFLKKKLKNYLGTYEDKFQVKAQNRKSLVHMHQHPLVRYWSQPWRRWNQRSTECPFEQKLKLWIYDGSHWKATSGCKSHDSLKKKKKKKKDFDSVVGDLPWSLLAAQYTLFSHVLSGQCSPVSTLQKGCFIRHWLNHRKIHTKSMKFVRIDSRNWYISTLVNAFFFFNLKSKENEKKVRTMTLYNYCSFCSSFFSKSYQHITNIFSKVINILDKFIHILY